MINRKLNGQLYKLKLVKMKISELMFNPFNTRIYDFIKSNENLRNFEMTNDKQSLADVQELIFARLEKNYNVKENKAIVESIKQDGVQEKMIVLKNNILLSGNNRLSIIKKLILLDEWKHGSEIEVFLLDEELTKEEIQLIELEIQNVQSKQLMYDVINNIRRAKELIDSGTQPKRALQLTNLSNYSETYVVAFNKAIESLSDFYETDNILEKLSDAKIFSLIDSYTAITTSQKIKQKVRLKKLITDIFWETIFLTKIPVLDFRFVINAIIKLPENESEEKMNELKNKVHSLFGTLSETFAEKISNNDEYELKNFNEEFSTELSEADENFVKYIDLLTFELKSARKNASKKKFDNIPSIDFRMISKTKENISLAKNLMDELREWLNE